MSKSVGHRPQQHPAPAGAAETGPAGDRPAVEIGVESGSTRPQIRLFIEIGSPLVEPDTPMNPLALAPEAALQRTLPLAAAAQAADQTAARRIFEHYRDGLAEQTCRRQDADLALFARFLVEARAVQASPGQLDDPTGREQLVTQLSTDLATEPAAWAGVTWGLVQAFQKWQLDRGYAIGSVGVRTSTVRSYAGLATRAGVVEPDAYALIKLVKPISVGQGRRIDQRREVTRVGAKKAQSVRLSVEQVDQLLDQPDPRTRLLVHVLAKHGMRVGEVALLTPAAFDLDEATVEYDRPKTDDRQQDDLDDATLAAARAYLTDDLPDDQPIFPGERRIRTIVRALGEALGIIGSLSPHDFRHAWATHALAAGTPIHIVQQAGAWTSPAMVLRYAEKQKRANQGLKLRK